MRDKTVPEELNLFSCPKHGTTGRPDCVGCQRALTNLIESKNAFAARGLKEDSLEGKKE